MHARAEGREACLPVPWPDLARVLDEHATDGRALRPGVHVLVGGTGSGKTQLALGLALEAARGGHPVWYIGLELDPVSVTARLAALAWAHPKDGRETVSVPWSVLDWPRTSRGRGKLDEVERAVAAEIDALPIRLVFGAARSGRGGFTVADLEAALAEATEAGTVARPALVVMDFLQLLAGEEGNFDDREIRTRIARASYAASNHTRDGRVAVLLVSATSREGYKDLVIDEEKGMPYEQSLVGAGKESGEIEYAATSVLVLARTKLDPTEDGARVRLLAVAKNRHGGTGWVAFWWKDGTAFRSAPGVLERLRKGVPAAPDGGKPVQKGTGRNAAKQGGADGRLP
jgi:KaiC/GvpD/RAD55 family RecA-like ATPase